jgi:hypothetical protein
MPQTIHLVHAYFTLHFATKMFLPTDLEPISVHLPTPSCQERQRVPDYRPTKFRKFSQPPIPKTLLYLRIPVEPMKCITKMFSPTDSRRHGPLRHIRLLTTAMPPDIATSREKQI